MAVVVLMSGGMAAAQTSTAAKPAPAASPEERTIPVDPATRQKIQAVFTKHAGEAVVEFERARVELRRALIAGSGIDAASGDFNRRKADLEAAQKTIQAELKKGGISTAVQDQEWKTWATAQAERAKAPSK
jgi:hypothetical protein